MKNSSSLFASLMITAAMLGGAVSAQAASHAGAPMATDAKKGGAMTASADMAEGEVRRVDTESKKITIKHGEIKNLDMPGMTMVFKVKDDAMLSTVKAGDKIRFKAEKTGGALVVTDIQAAK